MAPPTPLINYKMSIVQHGRSLLKPSLLLLLLLLPSPQNRLLEGGRGAAHHRGQLHGTGGASASASQNRLVQEAPPALRRAQRRRLAQGSRRRELLQWRQLLEPAIAALEAWKGLLERKGKNNAHYRLHPAESNGCSLLLSYQLPSHFEVHVPSRPVDGAGEQVAGGVVVVLLLQEERVREVAAVVGVPRLLDLGPVEVVERVRPAALARVEVEVVVIAVGFRPAGEKERSLSNYTSLESLQKSTVAIRLAPKSGKKHQSGPSGHD